MKICLFSHSFIFFRRLRLGFQLVVFICYSFKKAPEWDYKFDTAEKNMKKTHIGKMPQSYS